jgi:hypothetical protein
MGNGDSGDGIDCNGNCWLVTGILLKTVAGFVAVYLSQSQYRWIVK